MALRLNRAKVAAAAARRLDFDVTPPATQMLGFDATPPAHRRLESASTPPQPRKYCITPPQKCFSGRRLDFDTPPPRAERNIPAADRIIPPPRRFDSTSIVLPQWWNSKAVAAYFSNPEPMFMR